MSASTIVWFRKDLRLEDNAAWAAALTRAAPIIPLFIHAPEEEEDWAPGAASNWWLHHALEDLERSLLHEGLRLIIQKGASRELLEKLVRATGADAVFWNRRYEPAIIRRDTSVKHSLRADGIEARSFNSALLFEPWQVETQTGGPYRVYTPFSRAVLSLEQPHPIAATTTKPSAPSRWPESLPLEHLNLLPSLGWDHGIKKAWKPTRAEGLKRLTDFLAGPVRDYIEDRNFPAQDGTSRLSPYLHFGQIGPREVLEQTRQSLPGDGPDTFIKEILWREFAHHVLYHFPGTTDYPLQENFQRFPWRRDRVTLQAWQKGQTGYPMVDAGLRQLWETGWMHNRVRMIVGSFLVKHLLHSWQEGAAWFWDTLVDADLANNTLGWQWAGGCGADAAPYFRIFNPITQGRKFDPDGTYVRRFIPELSQLPNKFIHCPWEAPPDVLRRAGLALGNHYPEPIIDHKAGRERALAALAFIKQPSQ